MTALNQILGTTLRLHARNKMALIYSYLFPTIFLVAFWVLYRYDQVPLVRHMGELLTVTALGGACFGLPTTMVSERERGVWRRYRLAPVRTETLVGGTIIARYVLLVVAGLLQLALAMGIGMPLPKHPVELFVAFTVVAFAFIGLGLVIAMMADNVPAVQALGQCIFLPMLIIGGVAVPLASLPEWAQTLSAFFPGRYAVEAIQACVNGDGLNATRFSALALLLIGAAGCLAGAKMFRWDAQQRFASGSGKGWAAVALAAWVAVGVTAQARGHVTRTRSTSPDQTALTTVVRQPAPPLPTPELSAQERAAQTAKTPTQPAAEPAPVKPEPAPDRARSNEPIPSASREPATTKAPEPVPSAPPLPPPSSAPSPESVTGAAPTTWQAVTLADIDRDLIFTRLPPDSGIVTPISEASDEPDPDAQKQLDEIQAALPKWKPGLVADPVQRVRNILFVPAVVDVFQMEGIERYLPHIVFDHVQAVVPKNDLIKVLYWIALHPFDGDDSAVDELRSLGLGNGPGDIKTTRDRVAVYAVKLLGRITGKIPTQ
jgi:outer membrane biosynthesis protein TonB/ABC-type transport system involved in cytochrome c biogenesis permease component